MRILPWTRSIALAQVCAQSEAVKLKLDDWSGDADTQSIVIVTLLNLW